MPVCAQLKMHIALLIEDFGDDLSVVEEQMCLPESFAYVGIQKKKSMGNIFCKDLKKQLNVWADMYIIKENGVSPKNYIEGDGQHGKWQ